MTDLPPTWRSGGAGESDRSPGDDWPGHGDNPGGGRGTPPSPPGYGQAGLGQPAQGQRNNTRLVLTLIACVILAVGWVLVLGVSNPAGILLLLGIGAVIFSTSAFKKRNAGDIVGARKSQKLALIFSAVLVVVSVFVIAMIIWVFAGGGLDIAPTSNG